MNTEDVLIKYVEDNQRLFDEVKEKNVVIKTLTYKIQEQEKEIKKLQNKLEKIENNSKNNI